MGNNIQMLKALWLLETKLLWQGPTPCINDSTLQDVYFLSNLTVQSGCFFLMWLSSQWMFPGFKLLLHCSSTCPLCNKKVKRVRKRQAHLEGLGLEMTHLASVQMNWGGLFVSTPGCKGEWRMGNVSLGWVSVFLLRPFILEVGTCILVNNVLSLALDYCLHQAELSAYWKFNCSFWFQLCYKIIF